MDTTMDKKSSIIICGAGIAGVASAYYLLKKQKGITVILIDKNQPLSFTTSKSGENFRDYWPQKPMRDFVSDSIHLMNELRNTYGEASFEMNYSGYTFVTHDAENSIFGSGDHKDTSGYVEELTDRTQIQHAYPFLDPKIAKVLNIKNAGNIEVYAMGSLLLKEATKMGLQQVTGEILDIRQKGSSYTIQLDSKIAYEADKVLLAAGPFMNSMAKMLGFSFPLFNTLQRKFIIPDPLNIIPKIMPFTIYADAQYLDWSQAEIDFFASDEQYRWLLDIFPGGLHIKPEADGIKMGWAFQTKPSEPSWDPTPFDFFPQVVLKGASRFIPALAAYERRIPTPLIEYSGYYTRTAENWPLIGSTEVNNVFVVGALAGYGTMAACAAGNLITDILLGENTLPTYAPYFDPQRYQHKEMVRQMKALEGDGQL